MIIRPDYRSSPTPVSAELKAALLRAGGTNLFEEPLYRLSLAQERITRASGIWNLWNENLSVAERGGVDMAVVARMVCNGSSGEAIDEYVNGCLTARPDKVVTGMMELPVYDFAGWILEKWKPAPCSRQEWEKVTIMGGPAAGVYPDCGEYVLCAGPTPYLPTSDQLQDAIRRDFRTMEERPTSPKERVLRRMNQLEERDRAKKRHIKEHLITLEKDGPMSLRNRISLGAGRVRQEWADKAGMKGHYGN